MSLFPKMLSYRDHHVSVKRVVPPAIPYLVVLKQNLRIKKGSLMPIEREGLSLTHSGKRGQVVKTVDELSFTSHRNGVSSLHKHTSSSP